VVRALEEVAVVATKPPTSQLNQLPELGAALLSAAMALPCVMGVAHAESAPEKGTLSFKYLDYKERQQVNGDAAGGGLDADAVVKGRGA